MTSPHVSDVSDKADISESDSDDSNENELQVEKEGKGVQLIAKKKYDFQGLEILQFYPK